MYRTCAHGVKNLSYLLMSGCGVESTCVVSFMGEVLQKTVELMFHFSSSGS